MLWAVTLSIIDEIHPLAIPSQISLISMHLPSLVKFLDIYSSYCPKTKIWACLGQITRSKFDEICPLAIPNQIPTILFVLRFYGPVNPMGSCPVRSVYLTTLLLGRLSPPSGKPVLCTFFCQKLTTALLESAEGRE